MAIKEGNFVNRVSPSEALKSWDQIAAKKEIWDSDKEGAREISLNLCEKLLTSGWSVVRDSQISGIQRPYRIPIFAFKELKGLVIKVVMNPKKINQAGLKLKKLVDILELDIEIRKSNLKVTPVVYTPLRGYDRQRLTENTFVVLLAEDKNGILD